VLALGAAALVPARFFAGPALRAPDVVAAPAPVAEEPRDVSASAPPVDRCELERKRLSEFDPLPGAPGFEANRAQVLARAKAEPVVFLSKPAGGGKSKRAAALRKRLHHDESPWGAFEATYKQLSKRPEELRQVLLSEDGYLYAEDPTVAAMLATHVTLGQLFREPELVVGRGASEYRAVRKDDDYYWLDGPDRDQPARLWLFDRVAPAGTALAPARHVGISKLARELGTSEIKLERLTAEGALASLVYGELSVPAVLVQRGGEFELGCRVEPADGGSIDEAQRRALRAARVQMALKRVIDQQVEEALPFDEPKTEEGQQDGKLRQEWRRAYLRGDLEYTFNEDKYWVFDRQGRPHVPQVCVDFVLDSWERVADSWWMPRGQGRKRQVGRLDFDVLEIENRRSVEQLIGFAKAHPDWFELLEVPRAKQVPLRGRKRFFERLYRDRRDYQPGDVVVILGPRDDELLHYHSFFVMEADPVSGMPTWLAANAGRPRVRTWEAEMQNAPKRAIVARLRPRLEWLERLVGPIPP
jgi:hypothetical protein